jgi:hypothetical protein
MQLLVTSGIHLHFFILLYLLMQNYVTLAEDRRSQENSKSCGTKYWSLNACLHKFTLSKKYKHITLKYVSQSCNNTQLCAKGYSNLQKKTLKLLKL